MTLYDELCSFDNLLLAFNKARKGKTTKWYVRKFARELDKNLIKLESELRTLSYRPCPLKTFVIRDPKTRIISSSHFRDRVVHHAICNIIEPIFEKSFICDSYASRKGKGTHAALKRFDVFKRKVSKNGRKIRNTKNNNTVIGYVLKADIRHYFDTVDHELLVSIIKKKIDDNNIICLIKIILENHHKYDGKGMPIGNLTSQFFANVYLNELDYFVKHKLRAKFYIRYLDDFVILHNDKYVLETWKTQIDKFLRESLKLELHPEKTKIYPLSNGINFLGFRIFFYYKILKKKCVKNKIDELILLKKQYENGIVTTKQIMSKTDGWIAYAKHGNTYKLCNKIKKDVRKL